jgi:hypothetical protein
MVTQFILSGLVAGTYCTEDESVALIALVIFHFHHEKIGIKKDIDKKSEGNIFTQTGV